MEDRVVNWCTYSPSFLAQGELIEEELPEGGVGLHTLRLALLDTLIQRVPSLSSVGGVTAIPFFQVRTHFRELMKNNQYIYTHCTHVELKFILNHEPYSTLYTYIFSGVTDAYV